MTRLHEVIQTIVKYNNGILVNELVWRVKKNLPNEPTELIISAMWDLVEDDFLDYGVDARLRLNK